MSHLFLHSMRHQLTRHKSISILLLGGVMIAIYCISVMLGLAVGQYRLSTGNNRYATMTVDPGNTILNDMHSFSTTLDELSWNGIANVLYLTSLSDTNILIGWQGTTARRWFPITTGRFFNEAEQSAGTTVAFLSDNQTKNNLALKEISVGDHSYEIIGTGWITPINIAAALSSQSKMQLIRPEHTSQTLSFTILPFTCYQKEFQPSQILIHFNAATYAELQMYADKLSSKFPDSAFYLPDRNSDTLLKENQIKYGILGLFLCMIAGITVIQLMREWLGLYRKELYIYYLCGMPKCKCLALIYGHWLLIFISAAALALGLHYCTFPLLKVVHADYLPTPSVFLVSLLCLFTLSVTVTCPSARKSITLKNQGGIA